MTREKEAGRDHVQDLADHVEVHTLTVQVAHVVVHIALHHMTLVQDLVHIVGHVLGPEDIGRALTAVILLVTVVQDLALQEVIIQDQDPGTVLTHEVEVGHLDILLQGVDQGLIQGLPQDIVNVPTLIPLILVMLVKEVQKL